MPVANVRKLFETTGEGSYITTVRWPASSTLVDTRRVFIYFYAIEKKA